MKKLLTLVVTLGLVGIVAIGTTKAAGADMATGSGSVTIVGSSGNCINGGDIEISTDQANWIKENLDLGDYSLNSGESVTYDLYVRNVCSTSDPVAYRMYMYDESWGMTTYGDNLKVKVVDVTASTPMTLYSNSLNGFTWANSMPAMIRSDVVTHLEVTYSYEGLVTDATNVNIPIDMSLVRDYTSP